LHIEAIYLESGMPTTKQNSNMLNQKVVPAQSSQSEGFSPWAYISETVIDPVQAWYEAEKMAAEKHNQAAGQGIKRRMDPVKAAGFSKSFRDD
jgi:hypothetical protein